MEDSIKQLDEILRRFQDHLHAMLSGGAIGPEMFQDLMGELLHARFLAAYIGRRVEDPKIKRDGS